jgi:predicted TIM-barrel fold metal-dependent hydrolase
MAREYRLISGDSHLELCPDRWTPRVPAPYRERAPRRIRLPNGGDGVVLENRPLHRIQASRLGGVLSHDPSPTYDGNPGYGGPEQRVREQDEDGLDAEVLFTHSNYLSFWRGIRDDEAYAAVIHGYNEYLAEEYCPYAPDRLVAMGVIPPTNLNDAVAELEYCARAGLKGVALYRFPGGKGYPTPEDDRFWAASLDLQMPITAHTNSGSTRFTREGPYFPYPRRLTGSRGEREPLTTELFRFCGDSAFAPVQLAFAGVFDRFSDLQIYWAETQAGWLPFALWQLDDQYEQFGAMFNEEWGLPFPERRLSEYLRSQNLWGFLVDPIGVSQRDVVGVDKLLWGSDFPHSATHWPNTRATLEQTFPGVPEDERRMMVAGNAVRFFHLDEG